MLYEFPEIMYHFISKVLFFHPMILKSPPTFNGQFVNYKKTHSYCNAQINLSLLFFYEFIGAVINSDNDVAEVRLFPFRKSSSIKENGSDNIVVSSHRIQKLCSEILRKNNFIFAKFRKLQLCNIKNEPYFNFLRHFYYF
jgi:hypothetical protein